MLLAVDQHAPPSLRRDHRTELQWGNDFQDSGGAVVVAEEDPRNTWSSSQGTTVSLGSPVALKPESGLKGGNGLSIDTSPPQLAGCMMFKKRPSPPLTSPSAVKSSMAQKKKRPAPLLLPDAVTETGPSPPSTVVVGPTLSMVDLNELALEDMIYEGHTVYGIQSSKGRRRYMEDTTCAYEDLNGEGSEVRQAHAMPKIMAVPSDTLLLSPQAYFGVFDGHGGRRAADFAAQVCAFFTHLHTHCQSSDACACNSESLQLHGIRPAL